jgi:hypothetical protein
MVMKKALSISREIGFISREIFGFFRVPQLLFHVLFIFGRMKQKLRFTYSSASRYNRKLRILKR